MLQSHLTSTHELGVVLVELRDMVRGRDILERLLKIDPHNHIGHGYLGTVHLYAGERKQAIGHYEQSLLTDPNDPIVCGNLATLFAQGKRWADAHSLLLRALKSLPDDPQLHMSMCDVLINEHDFASAAQHYRQAIAVKPQFRNANIEKKLADQGFW